MGCYYSLTKEFGWPLDEPNLVSYDQFETF